MPPCGSASATSQWTRLWFELRLDSKAGPGVPLLAGVNLLTGNLKPGTATPTGRRHAAGAQAGEAQKPEANAGANGAKGQ